MVFLAVVSSTCFRGVDVHHSRKTAHLINQMSRFFTPIFQTTLYFLDRRASIVCKENNNE